VTHRGPCQPLPCWDSGWFTPLQAKRRQLFPQNLLCDRAGWETQDIDDGICFFFPFLWLTTARSLQNQEGAGAPRCSPAPPLPDGLRPRLGAPPGLPRGPPRLGSGSAPALLPAGAGAATAGKRAAVVRGPAAYPRWPPAKGSAPSGVPRYLSPPPPPADLCSSACGRSPSRSRRSSPGCPWRGRPGPLPRPRTPEAPPVRPSVSVKRPGRPSAGGACAPAEPLRPPPEPRASRSARRHARGARVGAHGWARCPGREAKEGANGSCSYGKGQGIRGFQRESPTRPCPLLLL